MKKATELYEISKKQTPLLVANVMQGLKEHTIKRCEQEAKKGSTYYVMYLNKGTRFIKAALFAEVLKLVREFEKEGYKVSIEDDGNEYFVEYIITFSWNGLVLDCSGRSLDNRTHLYDTDRDGEKTYEFLTTLYKLENIEENMDNLKEKVYGDKNDNA